MSEQVAKPVWNKDSKFALKFNKFITWPLGVWPLDYDSGFSNFRLVFSLVSQVWLIGVQLTAAYLECGDARDTVDYVMLAVCSLMALSKIITFRIHMNKIRTIFLSAMSDWVFVDDERDRAIMKSFAKTGRFVFNFQMGFSYMANVLIVVAALPFLMPPMVTNETISNMSDVTETTLLRELPCRTGCLFGHYRDEIYGIYYVYEIIMINVSLHGNVGSDLFLFSLLMHLCGQVELIKKDLREIGATMEGSVETREQVRGFIEKHTRILDLAEALKSTTSGMLVIQLFCNAGMNLMLGIQILLSLKNGLIFDILRPLIALLVVMLQLYLISYASDRLCSQSESVVEALYESKWYKLPAELQRSLYFVAMRANRPVNLVAGQFYTLNIENFKNILKGSFSYFSILRVMFDK